MELKNEIEVYAQIIERGLSSSIKSLPFSYDKLRAAMHYAVCGPAKRLRPFILHTIATKIYNIEDNLILPAAIALELVHNYSLVHDDLPSMDNDAIRRNKPSCHVAFGEDIAILAGSALLTLAFKESTKLPANLGIEIIKCLSQVSGATGMLSGQALDIHYNKGMLSLENTYSIQQIYSLKTGELFASATGMGAILADVSDEEINAMQDFGRNMGIIFQFIDDLDDLKKDNRQKILDLYQIETSIKNIEYRMHKIVKDLDKMNSTTVYSLILLPLLHLII